MAKNGDPRKTYRWQRLRKWILERDDICGLCGVPGADTVDHIEPIALGGDPFNMDNLRPAHARCNYARGDGTNRRRVVAAAKPEPVPAEVAAEFYPEGVTSLDEYRAWVEARGGVLIRTSASPVGAMHVSFRWAGTEETI